MKYILEGRTFILHYSELRDHYIRFIEMTDEEFVKALPEAAHLACIICFLKEVPGYLCLSDTGIIHELIHLMSDATDVIEVRDLFKRTLLLS